MSADNVKTIQRVYEAFQRGDIGTILDAVTDDVDWGTEAAGTAAPWWGARQGKAGAGAFFEAFDTTMEVEEFTPLVVAAEGDEVLTVVRFRAKSRANGKAVSSDLHHRFTFRDGKISYYRGTEDTLQTVEALGG
jgi:ketosteroid isomerase-like protein